MLVSVVISTYNRCGLLMSALSSVLAQTTAADEIIVVDDGSTDATEPLMRLVAQRMARTTEYRVPPIRYHRIDHCGYAGRVRNIGVQLARGGLVAFLDDDDLWEPTKLQRQLVVHQKRPKLVLSHTAERWVYCGAVLPHTDIYCDDCVPPSSQDGMLNASRYDQQRPFGMRQKTLVRYNRYRGVSTEQFFKACLHKCMIGPSTAIVLRDAIISDGGFVGGFRSDLAIAEDYELWIRLCSAHPVGYVAEPLTIKCAGGWGQLSKQHPYIEKFRIEALRGILDANLLSAQQTEQAVGMLRHKTKIWINGCIKRGRVDEATRYRALITKYTVPAQFD